MAIESIPHPPLEGANKVVQGLWIGDRLSVMERLSIASFLRNGHQYHLYVYGDVENVPAGTVVKDGNEILPAARIFQYREQASYSGFSNFFRYKLLLEHGGWWADVDIVCLKPFDFPEEHVFSSEIDKGCEVTASGAIKAPAGSEVMASAWGVCQTKDPEKLIWGETGPRLMSEALLRLSLEHLRKPYYTFCPIGYSEWHKVLEPNHDRIVDERSHAIHLWNEMWRRVGQDKDAHYDPTCLYEQLKLRYLGEERQLEE